MKIINLSDVVSITTSTPSEAEFFTSLGNAGIVQQFWPESIIGPLTVVEGLVTKDNEARGIVYPLINFKLKDGSNAILKIDIRIYASYSDEAVKEFQLRYKKEAVAVAVLDEEPVKASKAKVVKVDPIRLKDWKNLSKNSLTQFLSDSGMFEGTFVRVY